ncbi:MAG: DUF3168 domain-containing protein [Selenomonas sp.]|uniref:tail completion protein gp17 n=1 Tax=Selenomonas sp. TaxID=2053611 RepID=UPI0025FEE98D|nr:DUF3168 domain-containing protein [Selenomonas sp.]MCI6086198.1 DUF3168 domain-containing protein [Selenomonas sp.]
MNVKEQVYQALVKSKKLTALLAHDRKGRCIYPMRSPDAGSYPILVYSVISDVPALMADGEERERVVTVRIHILTKDGNFESILREVQRAMVGIGFVRAQATEFAEGQLFIMAIDYRTGIRGITEIVSHFVPSMK